MASKSLTGTWGSATFGPPAVCSMPQTTTKECYDMGPKFAAAEMEKNKFAKFTTLKNTGQLILKPQGMSPHQRGSEGGNGPDHFLTTQQMSYGIGEKKGETSHQYENGEIVAAMGRSGRRVERGLAGSGLAGEVLNTSDQPSKNSFVQRMWLYTDDSALYHRQGGVPQATVAEGMSFPIGEREEGASRGGKQSKMRASTDLMFNPIKNTGYKIFQDDEHGENANLQYHYKC